MSNQPTNTPDNNPESNLQPRINVPGNFPIKDEKRTHLKHPTPRWWPSTAAEQIALGHRVLDAIESVVAELAYEINNNNVANLRFNLETYEKIDHWHKSVIALGQQYTVDKEFLRVGPAFVNEPNQIIILKLDANAVATLGPVTANIECFSGLLGILIAIELDLKKSDAYNADQNYAVRLGYVKASEDKPDLTTAVFEFKEFALINGKPTIKWKTFGKNRLVDGCAIEYRETSPDAPDAHWHHAANTINSPAILDIKLQAQPREVELRGHYVKHSQQIGNWSPAHKITLPAEDVK
jgi:hypothetical protein